MKEYRILERTRANGEKSWTVQTFITIGQPDGEDGVAYWADVPHSNCGSLQAARSLIQNLQYSVIVSEKVVA